jgi:hypothetical protein
MEKKKREGNPYFKFIPKQANLLTLELNNHARGRREMTEMEFQEEGVHVLFQEAGR